MPRSSQGTEPCAPFPRRLVDAHRSSIHYNLVLWCCHTPGLSQRSSPPWGTPPLSALLGRAGSGGVVLSRNALTPREGRGTRAGVRSGVFDSSYLSKSQDTGISDKGKHLDRDLATHYLISAFWYFRYKNSSPLVTALCGHRFINPQYQIQ